MRYFLDTELNGFGGELISIALAPEDRSLPAFYATIECTCPAPWVVEHVLPVLGVEPVSRMEVADRFAHYLIDDEFPVLVADWPEDIAQAALLLLTGPGVMRPIRSMRFELVDPDIIGPYVPSSLRHNAGSDAVALRDTVLAYERRMKS